MRIRTCRGKTIADVMMVSKGITLLTQNAIFNDDIQEWRRQPADLKTWAEFIAFYHRAHREKRRTATTEGKRGYTAEVQNIYGMPPLDPP